MVSVGKPLLRFAAFVQLAGFVAPAPARADTPPAAHTLQVDFDAASAAFAAGHCADAETIFARLAADPRVKAGSLPAAMIAMRRGECRILTGDAEEGETGLRESLPVVEAAGPDLAIDAALGWIALARLAAHNYDHDGAVAAFRHALALPGQGDSVGALLGLAMVTAFDGDGTALPLTDRALARIATAPAGHDRSHNEATVHTFRARILMNLGRYAEASKEAESALTLAGGLTDRVSLDDVSLRSDAAEAALLNGKPDRARELLAYTGAGRIAQSPFNVATVMQVPDCDDSVGLRPDDNAVVEFSITDDGTVNGAQTVFTRGNYATARAFASAVRGWVWQPEAVAKLPPFYRALVRVELRCSKGGGGLPGVDVPFKQRIAGWAAPLLDAPPPAIQAGSGAANAMRQRATVVQNAGDSVGAGTLILLALALDPVVRPSQQADIDHAIGLLAGSEPAHRASAEAMRALVMARLGSLQRTKGASVFASDEDRLLSAADLPGVALDALAQDTLRLLALRTHIRGEFTDRETGVLRQVADDARLDAGSPLRQVALLRLASLAASKKHNDEAEALFARTGLGEEQCALIGDIPRLRYDGGDSFYPTDALRMGFEGWVREEYDIAANGHTVEPRTVIAYPPFVFVAAATAMADGFRYDPSFRPSGKLACSARAETIRFQIPSNH